jgi:hypothetical protein
MGQTPMCCRRLVAVFFLAASFVTIAIAADKKNERVPCEAHESIGVAHMDQDGVIVLRIRSLPPGPIAEGEFRYAPGDPEYDNIQQHLGGIAPGESKSVRPWC